MRGDEDSEVAVEDVALEEIGRARFGVRRAAPVKRAEVVMDGLRGMLTVR